MYKEDLTKGKDDWMNYVNKRKQIKEDRVEDAKHNEEVAKKQIAKKEEKKKRPAKPPGQSFHLG